jgi:hypothetical protein
MGLAGAAHTPQAAVTVAAAFENRDQDVAPGVGGFGHPQRTGEERKSAPGCAPAHRTVAHFFTD